MQDRSQRFGTDPYRGQELQLWQGTILKGSKTEAPSRLIVSADCDILSDKGGGEFFTLDIVPANIFLNSIVFISSRVELLNIIASAAREIAVARSISFESVGSSILMEWLLRGDATRWEADLKGT